MGIKKSFKVEEYKLVRGSAHTYTHFCILYFFSFCFLLLSSKASVVKHRQRMASAFSGKDFTSLHFLILILLYHLL